MRLLGEGLPSLGEFTEARDAHTRVDRIRAVALSSSRTIEMVIPNDMSGLALVRAKLEELGENVGLPETVVIQLLVGVDELISNVIKYGWPDEAHAENARHEISIRIRSGAGSIEVEITDDGCAFDPRLPPPPLSRAAAARPKPGGVGLQMLPELVDHIHYERVAGRNRTVITKRYRLASRRGIK